MLAAPTVASCVHRPAPGRLPRIGFLSGHGATDLHEAFDGEMARLGYIEGRNITIVRRFARANTDEGARFAAELANMDLDLLVVSALPYALPVRAANPRMPMVIGTGAGLVANGFARSMEQPGGITTGMEELPPGLTGRRLELLLTAAPGLRRVGLLSTTPGVGGHEIQLADALAAAAKLNVEVRPYQARNREEIGQALETMVQDGMRGLVNFQGGLSLYNRQIIVDFAAEKRLPAIYQAVLFAEAGGLMTWAPDQPEQLRVAARNTDRILKGARPGDVPITYPTRYFLTLNRVAARRIGLEFPPHLLAAADRVIE